jgi:hypothetical protein
MSTTTDAAVDAIRLAWGIGIGSTEVEIEVGAQGGRPGKSPAHPPLVRLQLRKRGARDGPEHHVMIGQVHGNTVEAPNRTGHGLSAI